ncbi:MAG: DMT family transporter [Clostridia bacterium]|nr:DMT family transporter [Clostridia bacterium]
MKKAYILALITVCIWATMAATVKLVLNTMPPLEALCVSGAFAFLFLLAVNLVTGEIRLLRETPARDILRMAGLGFLGLFLYSALYYYGLSALTSQEACILNYLWPLMLTLFAVPVLGEKLTWPKAAAMALSFAGIVALCWDGGLGEGGRWTGALACVAAAACYGLFSVLNKKAGLSQRLTMMVIWLTVAVCSALTGLLTETWTPVRGEQWLGLLWLGVGTDAVAYLLWALALQQAGNTAAIANLAYLTPFLSLLVSALLLGEKIGPGALLALILIVGGILLQSFLDRRNSRPKPVDKPAAG